MSGGAPTPPGPGAAAVPRFLCVGVKPALGSGEQRGSGARARCRCHSWVIREINWGLGREAASKGTLCSDLPPAPAREDAKGWGSAAGGDAAFSISAHRPPLPQPSKASPGAQHPPILRKSKKKNQKQKQKMKNQSLRLGLPQEKGRRGSIQAGHPRLGSAASHHGTTPAWPQPSDADLPLPASVSPFLHLSPGLLEHVGHAAQRGLHFSSSPKAQLSHKTFGGSLVRQVSAWLPAEAELTPPLTSCLT